VHRREEPKVVDNTAAAGEALGDAARYGAQAGLDAVRQAKINVLDPTAEMAGNAGGVVAHGSAGYAKRAAAGSANFVGGSVRLAANGVKLVAEGVDRVFAAPALHVADRLNGGAEQSFADAEYNKARVQEQTHDAMDSVGNAAHQARLKADETVQAARNKVHDIAEKAAEKNREARERVHENAEAARQHAADLRAQAEETGENAHRQSTGIWNKVLGKVRGTERSAAGALANAAHTVGDKLEETEEHASQKEDEHYAKAADAQQPASARAVGAATAAVVAVLAAAATLL